MANLDRAGAVPLGVQAVAVTDVRIVPNYAVDVKEGVLPIGNGEHYLQVVDISNGRGWLLPVTKPFLRALGAQCSQAGSIPQPVSEKEGN